LGPIKVFEVKELFPKSSLRGSKVNYTIKCNTFKKKRRLIQ
jgi:hypothetical protein